MILVIFAISTQQWGTLLALAILPIMIKIGKGVSVGKEAMEIDPYLKKMALSTLLWVILFGLGWGFFG